jgi:hypothetical protein
MKILAVVVIAAMFAMAPCLAQDWKAVAGQGDSIKSYPVICTFPIWKSIKIGTYTKASELLQAAKRKPGKHDVAPVVYQMMTKPAFTVSQKETVINLVAVTLRELGFQEGASRDAVYKKALAIGLELCPPEVGPQLWLQYDKSYGKWLVIAMKPIVDNDGQAECFDMMRLDDHPLFSATYYPNSSDGMSHLVFMVRNPLRVTSDIHGVVGWGVNGYDIPVVTPGDSSHILLAALKNYRSASLSDVQFSVPIPPGFTYVPGSEFARPGVEFCIFNGEGNWKLSLASREEAFCYFRVKKAVP